MACGHLLVAQRFHALEHLHAVGIACRRRGLGRMGVLPPRTPGVFEVREVLLNALLEVDGLLECRACGTLLELLHMHHALLAKAGEEGIILLVGNQEC